MLLESRRSIFAVALIVLGGLTLARGQTPQAPTKAPTQTTAPLFRSAVESVSLDVVVTNDKDEPVSGLSRNDFEIIEHGRPQTLSSFDFISMPLAHRVVGDVKQATASVDVATNVHASTSRQWVIVIDDLHIIEQHILGTKAVLTEFLSQLPDTDQVAIVFVGRSDLSQGFTSDLGAQLRAVNHIKDSLGFAYDALDESAAGPGTSIQRRAYSGERHQFGMASIDVLTNVCKSLAQSTFPRRALVYVSEGMTYDPGKIVSTDPTGFDYEATYTAEFFGGMHEAFDVARKAGVPVYPIDPRGIPDATAVRHEAVIPWANVHNQWDSMRTLAENTGGVAFVNRPDLKAAVQELIADNGSFYVLGYSPDPLINDGKFHDVTVRVKGHPNFKVHARAGYTAPKPAQATEAQVKDTLDEALAAALPSSGLELHVFAAPVAMSPKGMTTAITLQVTYPLSEAKTQLEDTMAFGVVALDEEGGIKASDRRTFHFTATPKTSNSVTYTINDVMVLPSHHLTLRVGVSSQRLDRTGVVHVPIEVIDPRKSEIQVGTVVIGVSGPPREEAVPHDLLKSLLPFQPTTWRAFAATDTLRIFAPMFWSGIDPATVSLRVLHNDAPILTRSDQIAGTPLIGSSLQGAFTTTLPLAKMAPGHYVLSLLATVKGRAARRDVAFDVK